MPLAVERAAAHSASGERKGKTMESEREIVTSDLAKFGRREKRMAVDLLDAYCEQGAEFLGDGVTVQMNRNSGYVFLTDEDFNVGVMEGDKLVQFFTCPECGAEGTRLVPPDWEPTDEKFCEAGFCAECHTARKCSCEPAEEVTE